MWWSMSINSIVVSLWMLEHCIRFIWRLQSSSIHRWFMYTTCSYFTADSCTQLVLKTEWISVNMWSQEPVSRRHMCEHVYLCSDPLMLKLFTINKMYAVHLGWRKILWEGCVNKTQLNTQSKLRFSPLDISSKLVFFPLLASVYLFTLLYTFSRIT